MNPGALRCDSAVFTLSTKQILTLALMSSFKTKRRVLSVRLIAPRLPTETRRGEFLCSKPTAQLGQERTVS